MSSNSYKIKGIVLEGEYFSNYLFVDQSSDDKIIDNLSKINVFIGPNNSGKSRLLRLLSARERKFVPTLNEFNLSELNELIKQYQEGVLSSLESRGYSNANNLRYNFDKVEQLGGIEPGTEFLKPFNESLNELAQYNQIGSIDGTGPMDQSLVPELRTLAVDIKAKLQDFIKGKNNPFTFKRIYIPVLRGLRPLKSGEEDPYAFRTKSDYFSSENDPEIFTGLTLYEETRRLLLGNLADREIVSDYQEFLSETFFEGEEVALIPKIGSDVLTILIGDEEEQPIYNLGDGIQSIIIQTFPLFVNRDENLLVFIEEPELYLHPGLQRKLIETFLNEQFKNFQYFVTTHSNHFLDITLDVDSISIFTFHKSLDSDLPEREKKAHFRVENVDNEDINVLDLIGVRNSSIFLSNCTIWVEGITDRYYLRKFFEIFQATLDEMDTFREDMHYSFVEYGGSNITHWSFLEDEDNDDESLRSIKVDRICNRLFLITDRDDEEKNQDRHRKLKEKLGENYYRLEVREIENLLTPTVIKKVIAEYEKVDDIDELDFEVDQDDYKDEYLGKFIESTLKNKQRQGSYQAESGTISSKVPFCKKAIKYIVSKQDLSEEAKDLCSKIYDFIEKNNR